MSDVPALSRALRDEIGRLLRESMIEDDGAVLPAIYAIDEDGMVKLLVFDVDANVFRVTVEGL